LSAFLLLWKTSLQQAIEQKKIYNARESPKIEITNFIQIKSCYWWERNLKN